MLLLLVTLFCRCQSLELDFEDRQPAGNFIDFLLNNHEEAGSQFAYHQHQEESQHSDDIRSLSPKQILHERNQLTYPFLSLDYFISKANVIIDYEHTLWDKQRLGAYLRGGDTGVKPVIFIPSTYLFRFVQDLNDLTVPFSLITLSNQALCVPYFTWPSIFDEIRQQSGELENAEWKQLQAIEIAIDYLLNQNRYLDKWFTKNPCIKHPKLYPLPIGPKWQWSSLQFLDDESAVLASSRVFQRYGLKPYALIHNMTHFLYDPQYHIHDGFQQQQEIERYLAMSLEDKDNEAIAEDERIIEHPPMLVTSESTFNDFLSFHQQKHQRFQHHYQRFQNHLQSSIPSPETKKESPTLLQTLSPTTQPSSSNSPSFTKPPLSSQTSIHSSLLSPSSWYLTIDKAIFPGKDKLLYFNFQTQTTDRPFYRSHYNLRNHIQQQLLTKGFSPSPLRQLTGYLQELSEYKFCISPPGIGIDTHRTWEALMVGTIPIVLSSPLDSLYDSLPVVIVDSYDVITIDLLNELYNLMIQQLSLYDFNKLYIHYWNTIIN